jgi:hypothetical protein
LLGLTVIKVDMGRIPIDNPYTITTAFGVPDSNAKFGRHSGIDYAGFASGRAVFAPATGNLTNIYSPTGGNMVVIYDGKYHHRLMHNSAFVRGNGQVSEGEQVARAGTTGLSTGVHVHWDINTEGTYPTSFNSFINPNQWLGQSPQGGGMLMVDKNLLTNYYQVLLGRQPDAGANVWLGKPADVVFQMLKDSPERQNYVNANANRIKQLEASEQNLAQAVSARDKLIAEIKAKADLSDSLQKKVDALQTEQAQDQATGNAIMRFLGRLFRTSN